MKEMSHQETRGNVSVKSGEETNGAKLLMIFVFANSETSFS